MYLRSGSRKKIYINKDNSNIKAKTLKKNDIDKTKLDLDIDEIKRNLKQNKKRKHKFHGVYQNGSKTISKRET